MTYLTDSIEHITIAIPITKSDRHKAQEFAQQQLTPEKAEQIYRNTLAVLVTRYYLEMLDIPSSLEASYSWNPIGRLSADVADLYIPEVKGHLECRPIRKEDSKCFIPEEVQSDRIGYVAVQLDENYREGTVLGFVPKVSVTELPLSYLQPLDALIDRLADGTLTIQKIETNLSQWLKGIFEPSWEPGEEILRPGRMPILQMCNNLSSTSETADFENIKRLVKQLYASQMGGSQPEAITLPDADPKAALVHLIQTTQDDETRWKAAELLWEIDPENPSAAVRSAKDLGLYLAGHTVALMVGILPKPDGSMLILLRVYPMGRETHLPLGLQLIGLDESGNSFFEVQARRRDDYIQFKLVADPGDSFSVKVALEDACIIEHFIV